LLQDLHDDSLSHAIEYPLVRGRCASEYDRQRSSSCYLDTRET